MAEPTSSEHESPRAPGPKSAEEILNVREVVSRRRSRLARLIERSGATISSPALFVSLLAAHALWIVVNLPVVPWEPWDPYPFMFLATVASAEAPFLALLILMHQQRQEHVDELRGELSLQVSLQVERETTTILRMLDRIQARLDVIPDEADARAVALQALGLFAVWPLFTTGLGLVLLLLGLARWFSRFSRLFRRDSKWLAVGGTIRTTPQCFWQRAYPWSDTYSFKRNASRTSWFSQLAWYSAPSE
jgi:uncharacterized membrane protein